MSSSRRRFLRNSALAASAASQARVLGANDRIRVALIGCGGMGNSDLRDFLRAKHVECAALCDVDDARSAAAQARTVEPAGGRAALLTRDFRRVLDRKDIDAVIVATPDHWHALPTILVPGDVGVAKIRVGNNGAAAYVGNVDVKFYLSKIGGADPSGTLLDPAVDKLVGSLLGQPVNHLLVVDHRAERIDGRALGASPFDGLPGQLYGLPHAEAEPHLFRQDYSHFSIT